MFCFVIYYFFLKKIQRTLVGQRRVARCLDRRRQRTLGCVDWRNVCGLFNLAAPSSVRVVGSVAQARRRRRRCVNRARQVNVGARSARGAATTHTADARQRHKGSLIIDRK